MLKKNLRDLSAIFRYKKNMNTLDDTIVGKPATIEHPSLSFSHLALWTDSGDASADEYIFPHGFPASREEDLYETGYLSKIFLRC